MAVFILELCIFILTYGVLFIVPAAVIYALYKHYSGKSRR